ncbi:MAG TPA: hypothetical protein PLE56_12445 [Chitinophagales bacterium]|nr:hypothetical protein [Chitinophagales bacterium]
MKKIYHYTRRKAQKKGHLDGRSFVYTFWPFIKENKTPYPLLDQKEPAQYEQELLDLAEKEISEIAESWKIADKKLKTAYCQAKAERESALEILEEEEDDVAPEEANLRKIEEERLAFVEPGIPHYIAVVFHIILFFTEVFFNSIVFQSFGLDKIDSISGAVGIGLALTLFAYVLGKLLKKENKSRLDVFLIYIIPIGVVLALIAISMLRGSYMKDVEAITHVHFSMHPYVAAVLFFFLNVALFLAATAISYGSFSKNEELRNTLKKRYKHALKRLKTEKKELKIATDKFEIAEKQYIKCLHLRQKEFERHLNYAKTLKEQAEYLVSVYRVANLEKRFDGKKPDCFKVPQRTIQIHDFIPPVLDTNC